MRDNELTRLSDGAGGFPSLPPRSLIRNWRLNNNSDPVDHDGVMQTIRANSDAMAQRLTGHLDLLKANQGS